MLCPVALCVAVWCAVSCLWVGWGGVVGCGLLMFVVLQCCALCMVSCVVLCRFVFSFAFFVLSKCVCVCVCVSVRFVLEEPRSETSRSFRIRTRPFVFSFLERMISVPQRRLGS